MKKLFLILTFTLGLMSFTVSNSNTQADLPPNDDCGGCIAWADSRDDGTDRKLIKWRRDLQSCQASAPDCQENQELTISQ